MNTAIERPILFRGPMVQAILSGQKTVTRRVLKMPHGLWETSATGELLPIPGKCPYGKPGDRLWVRETWYCDHFEVQKGPYLQPADMHDLDQSRDDGELVYAADGLAPYEQEQPTWKPSIHMPRWASRILLEITDVRVEQLHAITNEQCSAEGARGGHGSIPGYIYNATVQEHFRYIWENTGGDYFANPWVWVITFKRITQGQAAEGNHDDA